MKIDASTVELTSSRRATMRTEVKETLRAWIGNQRPDFENATESAAAAPSPSVVAISAAALTAARAPDAAAVTPESAPPVAAAEEAIEHSPMLYLIKLVVEMLSGYRVKTMSAAEFQSQQGGACLPQPSPQQAPQHGPQQAPQRAGYGIEYDRHTVREENEQTTMQAQGLVRTKDGQEIRFNVALAMERSHREESDVSLRAGDGVRKDPLVINFDGSAAQLRNQRFAFDLDADGKKEDVPLLAGNRGFLVLDLNHNGKVDSGRELFGALSGDGFADLAAHDSDGNGWIDENDSVFAQLQTWAPDEKGGGELTSLAERGVGAIYLGRVASAFELRDSANRDLGAVRTSGIYLREDGQAGTVQQIDVTV